MVSNGRYVLKNGEAVEEPDLIAWGRWLESAPDRIVAQSFHGADVKVSTVFLGLDHSFGQGPPLLWETMIFGGEHDGFQERYSTLEAAKAGHLDAMKLVGANDD